jgi:hypothetical protein
MDYRNDIPKKLPRELTIYSSSPDNIGTYMFNWKMLLAFVKNRPDFRPLDIMELGYSERHALSIYGNLYFNHLAEKQDGKPPHGIWRAHVRKRGLRF